MCLQITLASSASSAWKQVEWEAGPGHCSGGPPASNPFLGRLWGRSLGPEYSAEAPCEIAWILVQSSCPGAASSAVPGVSMVAESQVPATVAGPGLVY